METNTNTKITRLDSSLDMLLHYRNCYDLMVNYRDKGVIPKNYDPLRICWGCFFDLDISISHLDKPQRKKINKIISYFRKNISIRKEKIDMILRLGREEELIDDVWEFEMNFS